MEYGALQKKFLQFCKSVCAGSRTVHEDSFAHNVATNFKLRAQMDCIIIYYVTCTQIANLLCKSPVREPQSDFAINALNCILQN